MRKKLVIIVIVIVLLIAISAGVYSYFTNASSVNKNIEVSESEDNSPESIIEKIIPNEFREEKKELPVPPPQKVLNNSYHIFQTFNNCGPAALSMALSYYGINVSQQELGQALRPYQNPQGDNDDKSTTLAELAEKSKDYDLIPYHRPSGNIEIVKHFIANDIPVVARTWLRANEDIGHYRVIKGYDDSRNVFIQDDSLQGKNLEYSYEDFFALWKPFNFEYLAMVPVEKQKIAVGILGDYIEEEYAWEQALETAQEDLESNPNDANARFNLSIALFHLERYQESVNEFEKVEDRLPSRALWYQIEPIEAYYELKDFDRVFSITDKILTNNNMAFSELYIIRGNIYKERNDLMSARAEYEKAVRYNVNLKSAKEALNSL